MGRNHVGWMSSQLGCSLAAHSRAEQKQRRWRVNRFLSHLPAHSPVPMSYHDSNICESQSPSQKLLLPGKLLSFH